MSGYMRGHFNKLNPLEKEEPMSQYQSLEQLPLALCAADLAKVLGISRAMAYELMHSKSFPSIKIGKRLTVPKDKLIEWMDEQIGL